MEPLGRCAVDLRPELPNDLLALLAFALGAAAGGVVTYLYFLFRTTRPNGFNNRN